MTATQHAGMSHVAGEEDGAPHAREKREPRRRTRLDNATEGTLGNRIRGAGLTETAIPPLKISDGAEAAEDVAVVRDPTAGILTTTRAAEALAAARAAQPAWAALSPVDRAGALKRLPAVLGDAVDRISGEVHRENGKPVAEAIGHDVIAAIRLARHHLAAAPKALADQQVSRARIEPHRAARLHRRPYGVVAAVAPWNLPFIIPISQVLPALLAGNAVVLKPAEQTPGCASMLRDLLIDAGLPYGLLQILEGDGATGAELIRAQPDKVVFTGSVATGRSVMSECAQYPIPVSLELGGVDAMIVRADADLEFAAAAAAWGATFNGGQACCSVERLIVHRSIHDGLVERIADKLNRIDTHRDLGPAIDERQHATWMRHVADARERDLDIVCGGTPLPGRRLEPALIRGTAGRVTQAEAWHEETFGPLVATVAFDTDDEAVALHNATPYGLTASVFTADVEAGRGLAGRLRAGAVAVNEIAATLYSAPEIPWGGVGRSGFGRSHGDEALLDATWLQAIDVPRGPAFGPKRPWWYPYAGVDTPMVTLGRTLGRDDVIGRVTGGVQLGSQLIKTLTRFPKL